MKKTKPILKQVSCEHGVEYHPPCPGFKYITDVEATLRKENRMLRHENKVLRQKISDIEHWFYGV